MDLIGKKRKYKWLKFVVLIVVLSIGGTMGQLFADIFTDNLFKPSYKDINEYNWETFRVNNVSIEVPVSLDKNNGLELPKEIKKYIISKDDWTGNLNSSFSISIGVIEYIEGIIPNIDGAYQQMMMSMSSYEGAKNFQVQKKRIRKNDLEGYLYNAKLDVNDQAILTDGYILAGNNRAWIIQIVTPQNNEKAKKIKDKILKSLKTI